MKNYIDQLNTPALIVVPPRYSWTITLIMPFWEWMKCSKHTISHVGLPIHCDSHFMPHADIWMTCASQQIMYSILYLNQVILRVCLRWLWGQPKPTDQVMKVAVSLRHIVILYMIWRISETYVRTYIYALLYDSLMILTYSHSLFFLNRNQWLSCIHVLIGGTETYPGRRSVFLQHPKRLKAARITRRHSRWGGDAGCLRRCLDLRECCW